MALWSGFSGVISRAKESIKDLTKEGPSEDDQDQAFSKLKEELRLMDQRCQEYQKLLSLKDAESAQAQGNRYEEAFKQQLQERDEKLSSTGMLVERFEAGLVQIAVKIQLEGGFGSEDVRAYEEGFQKRQSELDTQRTALKQKEIDLAQLIEAKAVQVQDLQQALDSSQNQEKQLVEANVQLKHKNDGHMQTISQLQEELQAAHDQLQAQVQAATAIDQDLKIALKEKELSEKELDLLKRDYKDLENAKIALQKTLEQTKEDVNTKGKSLDASKQQVQALIQKRKISTELSYRQVKEGNDLLAIQTQPLSETMSFEEVADALKTHNGKLRQTLGDIDSAVSKMMERFGTVNRTITDFSGLKEKVVMLMEISLEKLQVHKDHARDCESLYQASLQEKEDLKKLIDELNHSAENYAKKVYQAETVNSELSLQLKTLETEREKLLQDAADKSEAETQLQVLQTQLDEQSGRLKNETDMQQVLKEENSSLKGVMERLIRESKEVTETNSRLISESDRITKEYEAMSQSLASLSVQVQSGEDERQRLHSALETMQEAELALGVTTTQNSNEALRKRLDEVELTLDQTTSKLKSKRLKLAKAKETCASLESEVQIKAKELEDANRDLEANLKTTEAVKEEATQLLSKVSRQVASTEHLIDRRLISTFLFNYLNPKNSDRLKRQMMESMVNVLELSQEQRAMLGLGPETGLLAEFASFISREE